jgi:hypothetical protein
MKVTVKRVAKINREKGVCIAKPDTWIRGAYHRFQNLNTGVIYIVPEENWDEYWRMYHSDNYTFYRQ